MLIKGTTAQRAREAGAFRLSNRDAIVITLNYESFWRGRLFKWLCSAGIDLLIFDEVHKLKAPFGKASRAARVLSALAERTLGLTGTITPHSPLDAWSVGMIFDPYVLGTSFTVHRRRYAIVRTIKVATKRRDGSTYQRDQDIVVGYRNADELGERLADFCYHVGEGVLDLPDVMHEIVEVELGEEARKIYAPLEAGFAAEVRSGVINPQNGLVKTLRLQQLTGGSAADEVVDTAKRDALQELIENAGDEPMVVFGVFHADLDAIAQSGGAFELSGRRDELDLWREQGGVLAVQIRAGGVGIDLTDARYCVFFSIGNVSPGDYKQAVRRVHRPGQERPVTFFHLVAVDTIDEASYVALQRGEDIVRAIISSLERTQDGSAQEEPAPF